MRCSSFCWRLVLVPGGRIRSGRRRDEIRDKVESLIMMREDARSERNWAEADRIRDEISELGVVIEDGDSGATWRMKEI